MTDISWPFFSPNPHPLFPSLCLLIPSLSSLRFTQSDADFLVAHAKMGPSFLSAFLPAFSQAGRGSGDRSDLSHTDPDAGRVFSVRGRLHSELCLCNQIESLRGLSCFVPLAE